MTQIGSSFEKKTGQQREMDYNYKVPLIQESEPDAKINDTDDDSMRGGELTLDFGA